MKTLNHHKALTLSISELQKEIKFLSELLKLKIKLSNQTYLSTHTITVPDNIEQIIADNLKNKENSINNVIDGLKQQVQDSLTGNSGNIRQNEATNAKENQSNNRCLSVSRVFDISRDKPCQEFQCNLTKGHLGQHYTYISDSDQRPSYVWIRDDIEICKSKYIHDDIEYQCFLYDHPMSHQHVAEYQGNNPNIKVVRWGLNLDGNSIETKEEIKNCSSMFYIPDQDNPVNCRLQNGHFDMHEYLERGSTSDKDLLYKWHDKDKKTIYPIEPDNITLAENLRQILCLKPIPMILTHTKDKPEMAVCIGLKGHQDSCEQLSWYKIMSEVKVLLEGKNTND